MDQINKNINKWIDWPQTYVEEMESVTLQSAITLYSLVNAEKAKWIIDVDWRPSLSSEVLLTTLIKSESWHETILSNSSFYYFNLPML